MAELIDTHGEQLAHELSDLNLKPDAERLGLLLHALDHPLSHYARLDSNEREAIRAQVLEYAQAQGVKPKRFGSKVKREQKPVDLLEKLDDLGRERAQSLPLFANSDRLARKPRCSHTKGYSVIRSAPHALLHEYIQPNSPVAYIRLVFDLDWHDENHPHHALSLRDLAERNGWEEALSAPAPNWTSLGRDKNSAHVGYEIATPVGKHVNARVKPLRYLAAIESALADALGADEGYAGLLCKNPLHEAWDLYKCHEGARDLKTLAKALSLTPETMRARTQNRKPRGEVGRNTYLFDMVRFWAYENVEKHRCGRYEDWLEAVLIQAQIINAGGYQHLPALSKQDPLFFNECRALASSVAAYSWKYYGTKELSKSFKELQSWRGKRGAAAAAEVKRENREEQIIEAIGQLIAQGVKPTMGKVADLIGCTRQALSKSYKHLFHSA